MFISLVKPKWVACLPIAINGLSARSFPLLLPQTPQHVAVTHGLQHLQGLFTRHPALLLIQRIQGGDLRGVAGILA
jgi:hypothetical protein